MLHAGYLTAAAYDGEKITAVIPNREIRKIYRDQISDCFRVSMRTFDVGSLYRELLRGDEQGAEEVQRILATKFFAS